MQCNRGMSPGQAVRLASERTLNGRDYRISSIIGHDSMRPGKLPRSRKASIITFDTRHLPPGASDDMLEDLDLNSIADDRARELVRQLLNLLEDVMADLRVAQAENQRLRDEINRLKGEQGRPMIKSNQPQRPSTDHSSEHERYKPKRWSKGRKMDRISIDREQVVQVDPDCLPPDAQFKGYEDVVVQDVVFRTDNVLFHKEKFYSRRSIRRIWRLCPKATTDSSAWDQEPGVGVLLWGADERAEGGRAVAQCRRADL